MSVRVWLEDDVSNVLQSAALAGALAEAGEFRRVYYAALAIVGAAFGVTAPAIPPAQSAPVIEIEGGTVPQAKGAR